LVAGGDSAGFGILLCGGAYIFNWIEVFCCSKTRKACANTMRYD